MAQEEGHARHTSEVPDPIRAGLHAAGPTIIAARLQSERHVVADEEDSLAEPPVQGVQLGIVGWIGSHVEAGIPAQHVRAPRADDHARAAERDGRLSYAAALRERLRYVCVDFETEVLAEEVADPSTATKLVVELEAAVIPCVAAECADLDLAAVLRAERRNPARQHQPDKREHAHGRTPWGIGGRAAPKIGASTR